MLQSLTLVGEKKDVKLDDSSGSSIYVLKVTFLKFRLKSFILRKNCLAVSPRGFWNVVLNKFSYTDLGGPLDFMSRDPQLVQFSYTVQFPFALVPRVKDDCYLTLSKISKQCLLVIIFLASSSQYINSSLRKVKHTLQFKKTLLRQHQLVKDWFLIKFNLATSGGKFPCMVS